MQPLASLMNTNEYAREEENWNRGGHPTAPAEKFETLELASSTGLVRPLLRALPERPPSPTPEAHVAVVIGGVGNGHEGHAVPPRIHSKLRQYRGCLQRRKTRTDRGLRFRPRPSHTSSKTARRTLYLFRTMPAVGRRLCFVTTWAKYIKASLITPERRVPASSKIL